MKIPENFQEEFCDVVFFKQHRKPQPSLSHDFRNLGNSWDNVCGGVSFCRNGHEKVLWRIVVLNSFLETSHEDQYVTYKGLRHGCFTCKFPKTFGAAVFSKQEWTNVSRNSNSLHSRTPMEDSGWMNGKS